MEFHFHKVLVCKTPDRLSLDPGRLRYTKFPLSSAKQSINCARWDGRG